MRRMIRVTPMIGKVEKSRLSSLSACHALYEKAVMKPFTTPDSIGDAIAEALHEVALAESASGRLRNIDELSYIVQFVLR